MKISDLFKSHKSLAKLSHLKHLIMIAHADGKFTEQEAKAVALICTRENVSHKDLKRALNEPSSIDFTSPESVADKINYVKDLVALMMCDGDISDREMEICKLVAIQYGFKPEVVEAIILKSVTDLLSNLDDKLNNL